MLDEMFKETLRDAAKKLTGARKRAFMAKVTENYFESSARKAERYLGWSRVSVQLGLHERRTGITCIDNYQARGRQRIEIKLPNLASDIQELVDSKIQIDLKNKVTFDHARVNARALRKALIRLKGYREEELPTRQTISNLLKRLGYRLQKSKK